MEQKEKDFCDNFGIPQLNLEPNSRLKMLLAYRNDRRLFARKCDATSEKIISSYHQDAQFKIIKNDIWWGDSWEGLDSGFEPDKNQSFFEQFSLLQKKLPREGTSVVSSENSEFNSHTRYSKNCYLNHLAASCEDLLYCYYSNNSKDSIDCFYSLECTLCFHCSYIINCYNCFYISESVNCNDCYFGHQLKKCSNCFLCSNLADKSYYFKNKACSKEEFNQLVTKYFNGNNNSLEQGIREYQDLKKNSLQKAIHSTNSEEVTGEHLTNCKSCFHCFDAKNSRDCFNLCNGGGNDIFHAYSTGFPDCSFIYMCVTLRNCHNLFFSANCWDSYNLWYCDNCVNCKNCFGCVALKRKEFCFFNKQYEEKEYQQLVSFWKNKMTTDQEWGYFFPLENSPFCYNESAAQDFFPLDKEEIEAAGLKFRTFGNSLSVDDQTKHQISNNLELKQAKGGEILSCSNCRRLYKITKKELGYYHQNNFPILKNCPDCRLESKIIKRNKYSLLKRDCAKCRNKTETCYSPKEFPLLICENCYNKEVY